MLIEQISTKVPGNQQPPRPTCPYDPDALIVPLRHTSLDPPGEVRWFCCACLRVWQPDCAMAFKPGEPTSGSFENDADLLPLVGLA